MKNLVVTLAVMLAVSGLVYGDGIPEPGLLMYGTIKNDLGGATARLTVGQLSWTIVPAGGSPVTVKASLTNINDQFCYFVQVPFESVLEGMTPSTKALPLRATAVTYNRSQVTIDGTNATIVSPAPTTFTFSQPDRGRIERVDLQVHIAYPDSNADGLPDAWVSHYFGSAQVGPDEDSDHDGASNRQEYLAGTDPTDAKSVIEFIDVQQVKDQGFVVRWKSVSTRTYRVERSQSLLTGFTTLATGVKATAPTNTYTDTTATGKGQSFYRIVVE